MKKDLINPLILNKIWKKFFFAFFKFSQNSVLFFQKKKKKSYLIFTLPKLYKF